MFMQIVISYGWLVFSSTRIDPFLVEFRPDLRRETRRFSQREKESYNTLIYNKLHFTQMLHIFITQTISLSVYLAFICIQNHNTHRVFLYIIPVIKLFFMNQAVDQTQQFIGNVIHHYEKVILFNFIFFKNTILFLCYNLRSNVHT